MPAPAHPMAANSDAERLVSTSQVSHHRCSMSQDQNFSPQRPDEKANKLTLSGVVSGVADVARKDLRGCRRGMGDGSGENNFTFAGLWSAFLPIYA